MIPSYGQFAYFYTFLIVCCVLAPCKWYIPAVASVVGALLLSLRVV